MLLYKNEDCRPRPQRQADGHDGAGELEGPLHPDQGQVVVPVILRVVAGVNDDLLREIGRSLLVPVEQYFRVNMY